MKAIPALATLTASDNHLFVRFHESGVVEVVLANPGQRNAMSGPMTKAFQTVMRTLADPGSAPELSDLRAVLVRGEGGAFCAGGDLGWLASDQDASVAELSQRMDAFYAAWLSVVQVPVPTVAYIDGPAIGAGAAVALACDIRWVAQKARFSVPFTRLGLHPGMGTTYLLSSVVGSAMAKDLLLSSRALDAEQMLACGAATFQLRADEVLAHMDGIAANAPIATRLTKRALQPVAPASLDEALRFEGVAQPVTMATADVREGLAAAAERRDPVFGNE